MRSLPALGERVENNPEYSSLRRKRKKIGNAVGQRGFGREVSLTAPILHVERTNVARDDKSALPPASCP
jgi:hypothetical protein